MVTSLSLLPLAIALAFPPADPIQEGNVRVVDADTGAPIAGAEVLGVHEAKTPVWGSLWCRTSTETTATGWAKLASPTVAAPYGWTVVKAEGYAPSGHMEGRQTEEAPLIVELQRALPAAIRVLDYRGWPVPNLYLGFCVGCGHTPDVDSAITDRGGDVVMEVVGKGFGDIADIYPVGPSVVTDYMHIDWELAVEGGDVVVAAPGAVIQGTIVHADGSPAAGLTVGYNNRHRGPWTTTNPDGSFRLFGVPAKHGPGLEVRDAAGNNLGWMDASRIGVERRFRMPSDRSSGERSHLAPVVIEVVVKVEMDDLDETPFGDKCPVEVWDPATGWSTLTYVTPGKPSPINLTSGTFEIELGGKGTPFAARHMGTFELFEDAPPVSMEFVLPPVRRVELRVEGVEGASDVLVRTRSGVNRFIKIEGLAEGESTENGELTLNDFALPGEPFALWLGFKEQLAEDILLELGPLEPGSSVFVARPRKD